MTTPQEANGYIPAFELGEEVMENLEEQIARLSSMANDIGGETWDLSGSDRRAIQAVIDDHKKLREALRVIAFPRRGTEEEGMVTVEELARYAAKAIPDPRMVG